MQSMHWTNESVLRFAGGRDLRETKFLLLWMRAGKGRRSIQLSLPT